MSDIEVPEPREPAPPPALDGRRVSLRAITPNDYAYLYELSFHPANLVGWRYRGGLISPEAFAPSLWRGTLTQFKMVHLATDRPLGLVAAYNADMRNQIVYLAFLLDPRLQGKGWAFEGVSLFISYLFEIWPFRKVYLEANEFNYYEFGSGAGSIFHLEGCLLDYEYHDGRYWHKYIASISRQAWADLHSDETADDEPSALQ